ncbi:bacteriophage antitermination protein Q [Enterobacter ludwigii]|mgnify:CR=1 FL=1
MNAQQLEYVRIQLRAALVDDSGSTKGQLEAFAENPPADKDRNPRKPVHVVELEDGRKVQAENSALYVLETRSRRRPMPPIRDTAFCSSAWRRAVLKLDASQQAWIRYCYGFDLNFGFQREICRHVWENYEKQFVAAKLQRRVRERLIQLVWLAAQDAAAKNRNETYKEYAGSALGRLVGATQQAWSKTYAAHWERLKHAFQLLDEYSLYAVTVNSSAASNEA